MKKTLLLVASLISLNALNAQEIAVRESSEKFSTGSQNAAVTTIYENKADDVMSEWKKVLKDFKYEKISDKDKELFGDNIVIKEWGNNTADFYTKFEEDKKAKTVKMSVAVDLGGAYLKSSSDNEKYKFLEKMVKEFAVRMTKEPMTQAVKINEKAFAKLEDQQKDLEKDKAKLNETIEENKNKISKAEQGIVEKDIALIKKKSEVDIQKKVVETSAGAVSEQAKSSKKILEKLEGQLSDIEKDKKNLKGDIEDYKAKIKKAEKNLKENEENQVKKKAEIDTQKKVVEEAKKKLESIK
jgi:hypothetical protein